MRAALGQDDERSGGEVVRFPARRQLHRPAVGQELVHRPDAQVVFGDAESGRDGCRGRHLGLGPALSVPVLADGLHVRTERGVGALLPCRGADHPHALTWLGDVRARTGAAFQHALGDEELLSPADHVLADAAVRGVRPRHRDGLRRGELVGPRWSDIDLDGRVLYLRQQTQCRRGVLYDDNPKSRRRRTVPLPALCVAPLRCTGCVRRSRGPKRGSGGRTRTTSSRLAPVIRSSRGTSTALSPASPSPPGCGWSACTTPATVCGHAPHGDRSGAAGGDVNPRPQSDQHHDGGVHARRAGHAARSDQPHGSTAQEASRSSVTVTVDVRSPSSTDIRR
ncbi:putative integrase family protein [Streptomyces sp. Tu6071]|nr:putative integrase family protein [Streptomyces sp. Tu6071]